MNPNDVSPSPQQPQNFAQPVTSPQPMQNVVYQQSSSDDVAQVLVPTKNKPALLSYYFGIFGLIPFIGLPFSVVALILGYKGLAQYKANPTPGAKGHAIAGIVMGWIPIALSMLILLMVLL